MPPPSARARGTAPPISRAARRATSRTASSTAGTEAAPHPQLQSAPPPLAAEARAAHPPQQEHHAGRMRLGRGSRSPEIALDEPCDECARGRPTRRHGLQVVDCRDRGEPVTPGAPSQTRRAPVPHASAAPNERPERACATQPRRDPVGSTRSPRRRRSTAASDPSRTRGSTLPDQRWGVHPHEPAPPGAAAQFGHAGSPPRSMHAASHGPPMTRGARAAGPDLGRTRCLVQAGARQRRTVDAGTVRGHCRDVVESVDVAKLWQVDARPGRAHRGGPAAPLAVRRGAHRHAQEHRAGRRSADPIAHHPPSLSGAEHRIDAGRPEMRDGARRASPAVTCGVSMPISSAGPPASSNAAASRSSRPLPRCGTIAEAGRQPRARLALQHEHGLGLPGRGGDRLQRVGERRLGERRRPALA